jgi:hypothetical protein
VNRVSFPCSIFRHRWALSLGAYLIVTAASEAWAQGILYYSKTDGSIGRLEVGTLAQDTPIANGNFKGANPGGDRNAAFDPVTRLLWYSATDGFLHSLNVDTLASGPDIVDIGGANEGGSRHVFIDYVRRKLLTPITDGSVSMYNLADLTPAGTIPAAFFTDGDVGGFRHFATDLCRQTLWYAATDGRFIEMDPDTLLRTGRVIPFSEQVGANPGAFRHFVVDRVRGLLLYCVTDGSVASINLGNLTKASFTIPASAFPDADPGAGRNITYDVPIPTDCPPLVKVNLVLSISHSLNPGQISLSWTDLGPSFTYTLDYQDLASGGGWIPVPPLTQWPSRTTQLNNLPIPTAGQSFRVEAAPTGN